MQLPILCEILNGKDRSGVEAGRARIPVAILILQTGLRTGVLLAEEAVYRDDQTKQES